MNENLKAKLVFAKNYTLATLLEWWEDIGERPRSHFVSMLFGIAVLYSVKLGAWFIR